MESMRFGEVPTVRFHGCIKPVVPIIEGNNDLPPGTILALRRISSERTEARETQEVFYVCTCPPEGLRFLFRVLVQLRSDNEAWGFTVVGMPDEIIDDLGLYRMYRQW